MRHHHLIKQMVKHQQIKEEKKGNTSGINWWQLSLLGIGSIIGAGFFLGTSLSIQLTGPSVIISFAIAGIIAFLTFSSLAEMSVNNPELDSFRVFSKKAFGDSVGFTSGWIYWIAGVFIISSEVTALSTFTKLWFPHVSSTLFILMYSFLGLGINFLGVKNFGKIESFFAVIKISVIVIFIVFALLAVFNIIAPSQGTSGTNTHLIFTGGTWFPNGFKGFWSSMIYALFPFGGIAVVSIASSELKNRKEISKAGNLLIILLMSFYLLSLFFILNIVPWNEIKISESPFISVLKSFNIPYIDWIFNGVIISAAFSTMVGAIFSITRVVVSLAKDHYAPKFLLKENKKGVHTKALWLSALGLAVTVLLSYLLPKSLYEYITSSAGILLVINWVIILVSQIKLRSQSIKEHRELEYKMFGYPYTSYLAIILIVFSIAGSFFKQTQRIGFFVSLGIIVIITTSFYMLRSNIKHGKRKRS